MNLVDVRLEILELKCCISLEAALATTAAAAAGQLLLLEYTITRLRFNKRVL